MRTLQPEAAMLRNFLASKIHGARVTEANLHYMGSLAIDEEWMERVGIVENEVVHVANVSNGERLTTYAIRAPRGSREICANGAAAHRIHVGDTILIFTFAMLSEAEMAEHTPRLLFLDSKNQVIDEVKREHWRQLETVR